MVQDHAAHAWRAVDTGEPLDLQYVEDVVLWKSSRFSSHAISIQRGIAPLFHLFIAFQKKNVVGLGFGHRHWTRK
jgi:hypothetical protein